MNEIVKRYLKITVFIVIVIFTMNLVLVDILLKYGETERPSENSFLLNSIHIIDDECELTEEGKKYLEDNFEWAMILDDAGKIIYEYNLPDEYNRTYSVGEIADVSRWYMDDYPVDVLNAPGGVVILARQENSVWKRNISINNNVIIILIVTMLLLSITASLILSFLLSRLFIKDIRIIIDGVFELASDKNVKLPEKGYLKDVHKAVNSVSESILEKNKTIEKNNKMKKNWLIGVTHDIRTPLSIIVGNAEELLQNNVDSGTAIRADNIKNQVFKIKYLLDDINLISRLENYLIDVPKTEIELQKVLRESMAEVINSYRTDIFSYEFFDVCDKKIKIRADKHLLKRAFENILVNSVVHNPDGCHIVAQIKQEKEGVLIIFEDDGVGAGEIEIEKLNKKTSEHFEHVHGWGTIVTKQIIELYMGKVLFSALDSGMRVTIYLPIEMLDRS